MPWCGKGTREKVFWSWVGGCLGFLAVLRRLKLGLGHATRLKFCLWCLLCPATGGYRTGGPARAGVYACLPSSSLSPRLIDSHSRGP